MLLKYPPPPFFFSLSASVNYIKHSCKQYNVNDLILVVTLSTSVYVAIFKMSIKRSCRERITN